MGSQNAATLAHPLHDRDLPFREFESLSCLESGTRTGHRSWRGTDRAGILGTSFVSNSFAYQPRHQLQTTELSVRLGSTEPRSVSIEFRAVFV